MYWFQGDSLAAADSGPGCTGFPASYRTQFGDALLCWNSTAYSISPTQDTGAELVWTGHVRWESDKEEWSLENRYACPCNSTLEESETEEVMRVRCLSVSNCYFIDVEYASLQHGGFSCSSVDRDKNEKELLMWLCCDSERKFCADVEGIREGVALMSSVLSCKVRYVIACSFFARSM